MSEHTEAGAAPIAFAHFVAGMVTGFGLWGDQGDPGDAIVLPLYVVSERDDVEPLAYYVYHRKTYTFGLWVDRPDRDVTALYLPYGLATPKEVVRLETELERARLEARDAKRIMWSVGHENERVLQLLDLAIGTIEAVCAPLKELTPAQRTKALQERVRHAAVGLKAIKDARAEIDDDAQ